MAFTVTDRGGGAATSAADVSDTFTPAQGSLVVVVSSHDYGGPTYTGWGETFTQILSQAGGGYTMYVYAAIIDTPSSDAVNAGGSGFSIAVSVCEIEGADTSGTVAAAFVQSAAAYDYNPATPYSLPALSAFASATNMAFTAYRCPQPSLATGYTLACENADTGIYYVGAHYDDAEDASQTLDGAFEYAHVIGAAIEIAEASSGTSIIPQAAHHSNIILG